MKAIQFTRFGPPDVLEPIDVPAPEATDGNAVVQISAAAINPSDVKNVAGQMEERCRRESRDGTSRASS